MEQDQFSKNIETLVGPIALSGFAWGVILVFGNGVELVEDLTDGSPIVWIVFIVLSHLILACLLYKAAANRNRKLALVVLLFLVFEFACAAVFGYIDMANGSVASSSGPAFAVFGLYKLIKPLSFFIKKNEDNVSQLVQGSGELASQHEVDEVQSGAGVINSEKLFLNEQAAKIVSKSKSHVPLLLWMLIAPYTGFAILLLSSSHEEVLSGYMFLVNSLIIIIGNIAVSMKKSRAHKIAFIGAFIQFFILIAMLKMDVGDAEFVLLINVLIIFIFLAVSVFYWRKEHE